jgi:hypothetical protein
MKTKLILLFLFVSLFGNAQNPTKLNFGADFMLFLGEYNNPYGDATYDSRGGFFVEKPFQMKFYRRLYISPGVSFKNIYERYRGGGMGAGFSCILNHYSINSYLKTIYKPEIRILKPTSLYFGALGGTHLYTWEKGSAHSWSMFSPQANWSKENYREDPSHLYNNLFFGLLAGIELTGKGIIRPSIEVRWMPNYGEFQRNKISPFELAINLGIGTKKNK